LRWLQQHRKIKLAWKACLIRLVASAERPENATGIANVAGNAYWELRGAGGNKLGLEIVDRSVSVSRTADNSNPFGVGLFSGLGDIGCMKVGVGIGFLGLLVAKARRRKRHRSIARRVRA